MLFRMMYNRRIPLSWIALIIYDMVMGIRLDSSSNATTLADNAICTDSRDWIRPDLFPNDCVAAGLRFFQEEVVDQQYKMFEFLTPSASPLLSTVTQSTPRKYTYSKP